MNVFVSLSVTTEDRRQLSADILESLDAELCNLTIDVEESVYEINVKGIGTTLAELNESVRLRL